MQFHTNDGINNPRLNVIRRCQVAGLNPYFPVKLEIKIEISFRKYIKTVANKDLHKLRDGRGNKHDKIHVSKRLKLYSCRKPKLTEKILRLSNESKQEHNVVNREEK